MAELKSKLLARGLVFEQLGNAGKIDKQKHGVTGSSSMKLLGVFLLPPGWDASPSQGSQH